MVPFLIIFMFYPISEVGQKEDPTEMADDNLIQQFMGLGMR